MTLSVDRLVSSQVIFREVNERICELAERFDLPSGAAFICECSSGTCVEAIALDLDEYKAIRSSSTRFLVAPGHETLKVENIVERSRRYILVEKIRKLERVSESLQSITERQA